MNSWLRCLVGSMLLASVLGCGGGARKTVVVAPEYQPEYAVVFDDLLVPQLFGFDPQGRDPLQDPKLRERTLRSDLILPAKVETVSRLGGVEKKGAYELALAATGPALFGRAPAESLLITVEAGSPTYPWMEGAGARWVGTRLILFAKRFRVGKALKSDETDVVHFRGEADTPAMRAAVNRHLQLRVLRK